jgi:hypothetical protein
MPPIVGRPASISVQDSGSGTASAMIAPPLAGLKLKLVIW